jgi:O-antigen/teichoic acid export membrane protein
MSRRYLSNTRYSAFFFVFQFLVSLVVTPLIIRALGKEAYGIIVAASTLSAFGWLSLMDMGLQGALTTFLAGAFARGAEGRLKAQMLFSAATTLYLCCGVAAGSVVWLLSRFPGLFSVTRSLQSEISGALLLIALFNLLIFPCLSLYAAAEALQEYRFMKMSSFLVLMVWCGAVLILIQRHSGLLWFLAVDYLRLLAQYLILYVPLRKRLPWLKIRLGFPEFREIVPLMHLSADMFVNRVTGLVFNQTDVLIISLVLGSMALAADYQTANMLFLMIVNVGAIFNAAASSESAWLGTNGSPPELVELALTGSKLAASFILPAAAVVFVWGGEILRVWLGPDYEHNVHLLRVMLLSVIPIVATGMPATMLLGLNRLRGALWIPLLSITVNLVVSILFLSRFGILALGIGTAVAYFVNGVCYSYYMHKVLVTDYWLFHREILGVPLLVGSGYVLSMLLIKPHLAVDGYWTLGFTLGISLAVLYLVLFTVSSAKHRGNMLSLIWSRN